MMIKSLRKDRFLVVGRAGLDLYADPPGTETENAKGFTAALGGSAANIAVAIARQGGACSLLSTVSDDAVGRYTTKALAGYGVDTRYVSIAGGEARTSLAVVETRAVNCQSVIYRNGAADFELSEAQVIAVDFKQFTVIIATGTALAHNPSRNAVLKALEIARAAGCICVLDVDYRPYSWSSRDEAQAVCNQAAALCDTIVGNDDEFDVLSGNSNGLELAAKMARVSGRIVIYKMGAKGAITFANAQQFETPVYPVTALKPTGAGDAFMGGFLSGLSAGTTVRDAVQRGAATAAIVVTRVGCAPAMPTAEEVQSFMKNHST
jgi:5-dehydro-2-deoxygluconokinase